MSSTHIQSNTIQRLQVTVTGELQPDHNDNNHLHNETGSPIFTTPLPPDPHQPWVHPHLTQSVSPAKGRQLLASKLIRKNELLLIDTPYAIIPAVDTTAPECVLICSNPRCNRRVKRCASGTQQSCSSRCVADVIWCGPSCYELDQPRHEFECVWLQKYAGSLRAKWGEYNFGMLWLIVRILATRQVESQHDNRNGKNSSSCSDAVTAISDSDPSPTSHPRFKGGWGAILSLCGSSETWSHAQVRQWTTLVKKYLSSKTLPHGLQSDEVLDLICREEANSFGLYPRETGVFPLPDPPVSRGEQFGAAVYPRAAIANHSCYPNIIHKPDESGRMVFAAARDILPGEECCISYFDMTQKVDLKDRREHLQSLFRFVCRCERCVSEESQAEEGEAPWTAALPDLD